MSATKTKTVSGSLAADLDALVEFGHYAQKVIIGTAGKVCILFADGSTDKLAKTYDGQEIEGIIHKVVFGADTTAQDITIVSP